MAWTCVRCDKKIFAPRKKSVRFAFVWRYVKKTGELNVDLRNLNSIRPKSIVTHLSCPYEEIPGFKDRMRLKLGVPENQDHPLLI